MGDIKIKSQGDVDTAASGLHFAGDGLYLRVSGPNSKSWIYRYTLHGNARWHGLGSAKDVKLNVAKRKRDKAREQVRDGNDPVADQESKRLARQKPVKEVITFRQCAETFITAQQQGKKPRWTNPKHIAQWSSTLERHVFPIIGEMPVETIARADIIKVLDPIWTATNETARRVRGRIEEILDWAMARGDRPEGENPASRHGPLLKGLPKLGRSDKHHEALPYDDLPAFLITLRSGEGMAALALEFTILTAARTNEVLGATEDEISSADKHWTVPAKRMKAGHAHRVPLSAAALAVIERARMIKGESQLLFPNIERGGPLSNMAMLKLLDRMGHHGSITVHGFRATFKTWATERTNFAREVVEMALAHAIGGKVEEAYWRGDLFDKRRRLMDEWAKYCNTAKPAARSDKVVALRSASK